jgi:hypothetical protein
MKDGTYLVRMGEGGLPILSEPIVMSDGYWVSDDGVSVHGKLDTYGLVDALQLMDVHNGAIVGIWENEGLTYIDKSMHFRDREKALRVAEVLNQMAIYDCKKGEAIYL